VEALPHEHPASNSHRRAGVAAPLRLSAQLISPFTVHDEHLGLGLFDLNPQRTHRDTIVHAMLLRKTA
jgi:hypothetical protein